MIGSPPSLAQNELFLSSLWICHNQKNDLQHCDTTEIYIAFNTKTLSQYRCYKDVSEWSLLLVSMLKISSIMHFHCLSTQFLKIKFQCQKLECRLRCQYIESVSFLSFYNFCASGRYLQGQIYADIHTILFKHSILSSISKIS